MLYFLGAANIIGRIMLGAILTIPKVNGVHLHIFAFTGMGVVTLLLPLTSTPLEIHILSGLFGLLLGMINVLGT